MNIHDFLAIFKFVWLKSSKTNPQMDESLCQNGPKTLEMGKGSRAQEIPKVGVWRHMFFNLPRPNKCLAYGRSLRTVRTDRPYGLSVRTVRTDSYIM